MEKLKVGDAVEWKSQAGGVEKKKRGVIVQVVAAGETPDIGLDGVSVEFDVPTNPREVDSFIVRVENVRKGRAGLYWPPAGKLSPAKDAAPAATRARAPELPNMPEKGPLVKAAENYLDQAQVVKEGREKLEMMGHGVMAAMRKEGRERGVLASLEGGSWVGRKSG